MLQHARDYFGADILEKRFVYVVFCLQDFRNISGCLRVLSRSPIYWWSVSLSAFCLTQPTALCRVSERCDIIRNVYNSKVQNQDRPQIVGPYA